jgi:hypothetical protein
MFEIVRRNLNGPESAFVGEISEDGSWTLDHTAVIDVLRSRRREVAGSDHRDAPPPHVGGYDGPAVLLGTAFSFVHLLDLLAEQNLRFELPPGSRVMETGGYKGRSRSVPKPELHSLITERLGIPATHIVSEYGMSELSSQAYDEEVSSVRCQVSGAYEVRGVRCQVSGEDRMFRFPPWARTRIVSPESGGEVAEGETGLLQVFDLANVFSVMAIQTEDLAIRRGDGFELIGRAPAAEPRGCSLASLAIANSQ